MSIPKTPKPPQAIFEEFASSAIKNSHITIKMCWIAIFAGGTVRFISSLDELLRCSDFLEGRPTECLAFLQGDWYLIRFCICLSLYLTYIMTFFRFYVGDSRLFDIRYLEIIDFAKSISEGTDAEERTGIYEKAFTYSDATWRKYESLYLIMQTFVLVTLCTELNMPFNFEKLFLLLLTINFIWMVFSTKLSIFWFGQTKQDYERPRTLFSDLVKQIFKGRITEPTLKELMIFFPNFATRIWTWNNIIFGLLLTVIVALHSFKIGNDLLLAVIGTAFMIMNCAIDLYMTWGFYVPKFADAYRELSGLQKKS